MRRRDVLKLGLSRALPAGLVVGGGGWAGHTFLPPRPSERLESADVLARRVYLSLSSEQRERSCVPYDHPLRQYHNRGVSGGGLDVDGLTFTRRQRSLLTDLMFAGLSGVGRARLPSQFFLHWGQVHRLRLLICGVPGETPHQVILSGPHLNLRIGGRSEEGVAFGGPQVYGDQRGDGQAGLPGNVYRPQLQAATSVFEALSPEQRRAGLLETSPIQTQIELPGPGGERRGIPVASLTPEAKRRAGVFVQAMLSTYPEADVAYAWRCLDAHGGLDALHLSYFADSEFEGGGIYQNVRLEGPGAILYYRGHPHLHAFINIGMDADAPLSVGEVVGINPAVIEGERLRDLFEAVLRDSPHIDLAYYPLGSVVGRLRAGVIRTGDVYTQESWQDSIATASVRGHQLGPALQERARRAFGRVEPDRVYRVATTGFAAGGEEAEALGEPPGGWKRQGLVRNATVAWLRARGFPSAA